MGAIRLYLHYISFSMRTQLQYRASFVLQSIALFLITFAEFLALAAVFRRFGSVQGWTLPEVALLYGIISVSFAVAEAVPRGFDVFPRYLRSGDFDRILLRPRSAMLQVLGAEFQLMRVGRLAQALLVLGWAIWKLDIHWTFATMILLPAAILGGACLFSGLFIISAVVCFWTIESVEIVNCATYGGVETGQYPLTIYRPWFRRFFTFVVPLATINFFPAQIMLGRSGGGIEGALMWLSPLAGVAFLGACLVLWRIGVRHYGSTGS
jgi:ABC-2 type transport system permease protein